MYIMKLLAKVIEIIIYCLDQMLLTYFREKNRQHNRNGILLPKLFRTVRKNCSSDREKP